MCSEFLNYQCTNHTVVFSVTNKGCNVINRNSFLETRFMIFMSLIFVVYTQAPY